MTALLKCLVQNNHIMCEPVNMFSWTMLTERQEKKHHQWTVMNTCGGVVSRLCPAGISLNIIYITHHATIHENQRSAPALLRWAKRLQCCCWQPPVQAVTTLQGRMVATWRYQHHSAPIGVWFIWASDGLLMVSQKTTKNTNTLYWMPNKWRF